jgi:hypothetical protein
MQILKFPSVRSVSWALFLGLFLMYSCDKSPSESAKNGSNPHQVVPDSEKPVLKFAEPSFHFGTAREGEEVSHEFAFTNEGKTDLLISFASASCGCTVPEWPKEPIPPGGKGVIKATFNTEGKGGKQNKKIVITANTKPELTEVFLEGDVLPKQENKQ